MRAGLKQLAEDYAADLIVHPAITVLDVEEFASERGYNLSDDEFADVIIQTNKNLLEAYRIWKEYR